MPIATKEFHHFNVLPGLAHPVLASGAAAARPVTASTSTGPAYITQIIGTGAAGYFADQYNNPRLLLSDTVWNMIPNAGNAGYGTWQEEIDFYCDSRGAQGFTAMETCVFADSSNGTSYSQGATWDGVNPWVSGGDPTTGFNETFWARVDYLIAACARNGMAAWLNLAYGDAQTSPNAFYNWTTTWAQAFGAGLAARYASTPNIIWQYGGDYYGSGASFGNLLSAVLTGLRGGGDTHVISIENSSESSSRYSLLSGNAQQIWGYANAQFNSLYIYIQTYFGIRYAYAEASPIPAVWMDGYYYKSSGGANVYYAPYDRSMRQYVWWALSSGARGCNTASESVYEWVTGQPAEVTSEYFFTHTAGHIYTAVSSLPGWWKLLPDVGNTLVTAGGGTPVASDSGAHYGEATTDSYVTASYAADGSLALIYLSHASTITVDTALVTAGYSAKWIDPDSGTVYAGTTGTTYNSGATDGSKPVLNSVGDPDWVLALKGP